MGGGVFPLNGIYRLLPCRIMTISQPIKAPKSTTDLMKGLCILSAPKAICFKLIKYL